MHSRALAAAQRGPASVAHAGIAMALEQGPLTPYSRRLGAPASGFMARAAGRCVFLRPRANLPPLPGLTASARLRVRTERRGGARGR
jgi:hypothetical protein